MMQHTLLEKTHAKALKLRVMSFLALLLIQLLFAIPAFAKKNIAFYYEAQPPVQELAQFERVVLEPDTIQTQELTAIKQYGARAYAYVSIGEVGKGRSWANQIKPDWVLGKNSVWHSQVMDLKHKGWQDFIIKRSQELYRLGYDGLFLDTMDSYQLHSATDAQKHAQEKALVELVTRIKQTSPQLHLITNRGFEVVEQIADSIEAVAAESLFAGWNQSEQVYTEVNASSRTWLTGQFEQVKKLGLEAIAIDYLHPRDRDKARELARKISAAGVTPWIANPELSLLGISSLEVMPRRILMLYDSKVNPTYTESNVFRFLGMPIEYMGYVPEYHDVRKGLPSGILQGQYAGIVTWFREPLLMPEYRTWLLKQMDNGVAVSILGVPGFELHNDTLQYLGLRRVNDLDHKTLEVKNYDELYGYELKLSKRIDGLLPLKAYQADVISHLTLSDSKGLKVDPVVTGPWGGLALNPAVMQEDYIFEGYWIINPFDFLRRSLKLAHIPVPDTTTRNGRRLWMSHIDGDALPSVAEMPGKPLGAKVILDEIIRPYDLPITVSIVEGEINGVTKFAPLRDRMTKVAREIFASPIVEIATHSYSHPFDWMSLRKNYRSGQYNLSIPNYRYDVDREISGSVKYINENLAPPGKTTKIMLWSGTALPGEDALRATQDAGLLNINGGNTTVVNRHPSMTRISPMSRPLGDFVQALAPIMNENVYTNDWTGPFYGFRNVIETMQLTDYPRRIKPIDIYYHFYIGTKFSSINSLKEVYDWTLSQEIFPIHLSEYIPMATDFRHAGIARDLSGKWILKGLGSIRSLRFEKGWWPQIEAAQGIIGARQLHDGVYIHTDGNNKLEFALQERAPDGTFLSQSNAELETWRWDGDLLTFSASGHQPVLLEIASSAKSCKIKRDNATINGSRIDGGFRFDFKEKESGYAILECEA